MGDILKFLVGFDPVQILATIGAVLAAGIAAFFGGRVSGARKAKGKADEQYRKDRQAMDDARPPDRDADNARDRLRDRKP
ncbi:MAG: hypothetical protein ACPGVA_16830 [Pikeienuella sp.]